MIHYAGNESRGGTIHCLPHRPARRAAPGVELPDALDGRARDLGRAHPRAAGAGRHLPDRLSGDRPRLQHGAVPGHHPAAPAGSTRRRRCDRPLPGARSRSSTPFGPAQRRPCSSMPAIGRTRGRSPGRDRRKPTLGVRPGLEPAARGAGPLRRRGLYKLTHHLRSPQHQRAAASPTRAIPPRGILVVLPALTWQGQNVADDNGDGIPDTLDTGGPVSLARPLAAGLPAGFADEAAFLAYLDHAHLPYDLTTDLGLIDGVGPGLFGHAGVVFAGRRAVGAAVAGRAAEALRRRRAAACSRSASIRSGAPWSSEGRRPPLRPRPRPPTCSAPGRPPSSCTARTRSS